MRCCEPEIIVGSIKYKQTKQVHEVGILSIGSSFNHLDDSCNVNLKLH